MGCRGVTPCPADLFKVRYLGSTTLSLSRKQIGIGVLQRPLLELYSAARRRGDDHRKSATLTLNQRLDISDYGLVVAKNDQDNSTIVIKVITPISNIALWAAVRFHSKISKRRNLGASFAPIACSEGIVDPKWYIQLGNKQRFLINLTHPSLFTCLLRRVASPKSYECHAFVCATAEDALTISSLLGNVKDHCDRLGSISPFVDSNYYKNSILSSELLLYTEDDTVTDVTIPHSPLTPSSGIDYRKSDVFDDNHHFASSYSGSTCMLSDGKQSTAYVSEKSNATSPLDIVTVNVQSVPRKFHPKEETMTISKTMDFGSESEAGWSCKWEPVVPPRKNQKAKQTRNEPLLQIREHRRENVNNSRNWEKEELSETLDFSSESDLSSGSDSRFQIVPTPHSLTTDSDLEYRIKQKPLRRSFHSEPKHLDNGYRKSTTPDNRAVQWKNWSSDQYASPVRSATLPRTKTKPKGIRWCSDEPKPQRPSLLVAIKKFSVRSFSRAKCRTDKLINSFRSKIKKMKSSKDANSSADSAYDTPEVCLSPDGNTTTRQKVWRFSNETPVNPCHSRTLKYPCTLDNGESSSGSQLGNPVMRQAPHRKKRRRRRRWQPGPKSSSDSGVEEYHSDYSDTLNGMQKSESELEHFASKVSLVSVEHGMSPAEFRKWSKTNMQEELGYIP